MIKAGKKVPSIQYYTRNKKKLSKSALFVDMWKYTAFAHQNSGQNSGQMVKVKEVPGSRWYMKLWIQWDGGSCGTNTQLSLLVAWISFLLFLAS